MRYTITADDETKRAALAAIGVGLPDETTTLEVTTYNGWVNRETWCLVLQFDNDQGLYVGALEAVREYVEARREINEEPNAHYAGEAVKDYAESLLTVDGYADTFGEDQLPAALSRIAEDIGSLYRVDWDEVGEHYLTAFNEAENLA